MVQGKQLIIKIWPLLHKSHLRTFLWFCNGLFQTPAMIITLMPTWFVLLWFPCFKVRLEIGYLELKGASRWNHKWCKRRKKSIMSKNIQATLIFRQQYLFFQNELIFYPFGQKLLYCSANSFLWVLFSFPFIFPSSYFIQAYL